MCILHFAVCCRHTSGNPSHAAAPEPFGGWQRYAQPAAVAVPPEPIHHAVVQIPTGNAADHQPVADAHAANESQIAVRGQRLRDRWTAAMVVDAGLAAGQEQHLERGRRPTFGVQTPAAVVARHVLPTGGRHHQQVRRDGAESAERLEARFADRHPNTGARTEVLRSRLSQPSSVRALDSLDFSSSLKTVYIIIIIITTSSLFVIVIVIFIVAVSLCRLKRCVKQYEKNNFES